MNRFFLAMTTAIALATPICAQEVELKLWAPVNFTPAVPVPEARDVYNELYAEFQAQNPNIKITYEVLPGASEALQQVLVAAAGGGLPDVAVLDGYWIPRLQLTGKLQPLNDYWSKESRARFMPAVIDAVTIDDNIYSVWFYQSWRGLYFRKDMAKKLGYDAPPATLEAFIEFGAKAKEAGLVGIMQPGRPSEITTINYLSMFWGMGGSLVDADGKPVLAEPGNKQALIDTFAIYKQLVDGGAMPSSVSTLDENALRPYFYSKEAVSVAQSSTYLKQMQIEDESLANNMGAMDYPMPKGKSIVPVLTGWTYGIFAEDPEVQKAAWKFIEFMTAPENLGRLNAAQGQLPVVSEIWDQPYYSEPLPQTLRKLLETNDPRPRPAVPVYPAISTAISTALSSVVAGTLTPEQAADQVIEEAESEYTALQR